MGVGDPERSRKTRLEYIGKHSRSLTLWPHLSSAKLADSKVHVVPHTLNLVPSIQWVNARWGNLLDGLAIEIHKNAGGGTGSEVWTPRTLTRLLANSQSIADSIWRKKLGFAKSWREKRAQNNRWGRLGW